MNQTAGGKKPITAHAKTKILVLIGQLRAATHGEASLQASHPSAHGKHSNVFTLLYNDISPLICYNIFGRIVNFASHGRVHTQFYPE